MKSISFIRRLVLKGSIGSKGNGMIILCFLIFVTCGAFYYFHCEIPEKGLHQVRNYSNELGSKTNRTIQLEAVALVHNIPPLPYILGEDEEGLPRKSDCARFPSLFDLEFSNTYWQTLRTSNGTFYFYGAYFDDRAKNPEGSSIRILGMLDRIEPNMKPFCQIWFDGQKRPIITRVMEYTYIWHESWGLYEQGVLQPYMLTCKLPKSHFDQIPSSVSIVEEQCDAARNNLLVSYEKPAQKKEFAVCVKGMNYPEQDLSVRLIEWIELLDALGADKIYFYELSVHSNISKVLKHYQGEGKIEVTPLTLPGDQPNEPSSRTAYLKRQMTRKRQNELIPYNDCFSRNIYKYKYITLLDIDEVIMPLEDKLWSELLTDNEHHSWNTWKSTIASYCFQNVYFFDDGNGQYNGSPEIPNYLHMLQHVYRSNLHSPLQHYVKCFHNPELVLTVHNHLPRDCLNGYCKTHSVDKSIAQLQHYRADCTIGIQNCTTEYRQATVLDTTIWRYKDRVIQRAAKVIRNLGLVS